MSTERVRIDRRKPLRASLALIAAIMLAYGVGWPLSYLTPILVVQLVSAPGPGLNIPSGIKIVLLMIISVAIGLTLSMLTLQYPAVFLALAALLIFHTYAAPASALPLVVKMLLLICLTLLPLLWSTSPGLALLVAQGLLQSALVAVCLVLFSNGLIVLPVTATVPRSGPAARVPEKTQSSEISNPNTPPRDQRTHDAFARSVILSLMLFLCLRFELIGASLALLFTVVLSLQHDADMGRRSTLGLLLGNAGGWLIATLVFFLLVAAPTFPLVVAWLTLVALLLLPKMFSTHPSAPIYKPMLNTVFALIGATTIPLQTEVTLAFIDRVLQIGFAGIYVSAMLALLTRPADASTCSASASRNA